jgi:Sec-independent protein translocase protein TatA
MSIGWQGLVIIVVAVVLVFGITRLPELMRSLHKMQSDYRLQLHRSGPARAHPEDVEHRTGVT